MPTFGPLSLPKYLILKTGKANYLLVVRTDGPTGAGTQVGFVCHS